MSVYIPTNNYSRLGPSILIKDRPLGLPVHKWLNFKWRRPSYVGLAYCMGPTVRLSD